jgi:hypothetical protein
MLCTLCLQALHLYQEVLDRGLVWGPDISYAMLKNSLNMQAAGVEDAMLVAHALLDHFQDQGEACAGVGEGEGGLIRARMCLMGAQPACLQPLGVQV